MPVCVLNAMQPPKFEKAEDLFNLNTKGFRGEALASIAAIAHVDSKNQTRKRRTRK